MGKMTLAPFLALTFACVSSASAVNYFNWGAETADSVNFGATIGPIYAYENGTSRDCTVAHSGSCSMRLDVIGNDGGNQPMGIDIDQNPYPWNMVDSRALYYRWWMRIQPGFSWGNSVAKTKSSRVGAGTQGYTGYLMSYGFLIGECSDGGCTLNTGGSNSADSELHIPYDFRSRDDGAWHEYIVRIKPNTRSSCNAPIDCDAQFEVWVDGVSIGQYNGFKLHAGDDDAMNEFWSGWMVSPYFQLFGAISDGGTIYVDDISTDDAYNTIDGASLFSDGFEW